jgi:hypothetical membrane protein
METTKLSGALLFLAGSIAFLGIITAEAFYPIEYTTFKNEISDLGATRPPNSLIFQPSATLFNTSMFTAGIFILVSAFLQQKLFKEILFTIPFGLFGLGLVGVGVFPGNIDPYHGLSSMLVFLSGGIAAITAFKIVLAPFKYFGIMLGFTALTAWFLAMFFPSILFSSIGMGGTERWVAYPILLWLTGLGGYLMNESNTQSSTINRL